MKETAAGSQEISSDVAIARKSLSWPMCLSIWIALSLLGWAVVLLALEGAASIIR